MLYKKRGSSAGEVTITGADGNGWDLRSDTVKLDQHVEHQVTVTGTASHETKAEEKQRRAGGERVQQGGVLAI